MPTGKGRGDGDEGSHINYHIGYLEVDQYNTGPPKINRHKAYIRTGPHGMKIKDGQHVDFEIHRYFLIRMDNVHNSTLKGAEDNETNWNAAWNKINKGNQYDGYIKIAEKKPHEKQN